MSRKANEAIAARKLIPPNPVENGEIKTGLPDADPRTKTILAQIDQLDKDFNKADTKTRIQIATAKDKLWRLIFPSPGSLKPKTPKPGRSQSSDPEPE